MNKTSTTIICAAIIGLNSTSLLAQEEDNKLNYNLIGLEYVYNALDTTSDTAPDFNIYLDKGYAVEASYALDDRVLFRGYYYDGDGDRAGQYDLSLTTTEIGISALNVDDDNVGIDGGLLWRQDDFGDDADVELEGLGLGFGVRANVWEKHEFGARFGIYFGDFEDSVGIKLSYAWNPFDRWGFTLGYEYFDVGIDLDDPEDFEYTQDKFSAGVRFYF